MLLRVILVKYTALPRPATYLSAFKLRNRTLRVCPRSTSPAPATMSQLPQEQAGENRSPLTSISCNQGLNLKPWNEAMDPKSPASVLRDRTPKKLPWNLSGSSQASTAASPDRCCQGAFYQP